MQVSFTLRAEKNYKKLSPFIKKKADKQLLLLTVDPRHPSLRVKKQTSIDRFEARIDNHYRFTFIIDKNTIHVFSIGPHDEGLGKK